MPRASERLPVPDRVILVDNASTDGTPERARERFPHVEVVKAGRNLGYGPACNMVAGRCHADVLVFINNDAFARPDFLDRLAAVADAEPRAGSSRRSPSPRTRPRSTASG